MRILHCCLSCYYVDGFGYQENYLPICNQQDGHEIMIIASTETFVDGKLCYVDSAEYLTETGIPIARLNYTKFLPHAVSRKIRRYRGLMRHLMLFRPEVILFHGTCAFDLITVKDYVRKNPSVKLYVDSHETLDNSARGIWSRFVLHKLFYRFCFRQALPYINKVLYVGAGEREYLKDMMGISDNLMEFYPLGGLVIDEIEKIRLRGEIRRQLGLKNTDIFLLHSGKLDKQKKTYELLNALSQVHDQRLRLLIIGSMPDDQKSILEPIIASDKRVQFLGWKPAGELVNYLAATDLYLQPGSVSATLQNAICAGTPVLVYPHQAYERYVRENGFLAENEQEMIAALMKILYDPEILADMSQAAYKYAMEFLDYRKLAARLYV